MGGVIVDVHRDRAVHNFSAIGVDAEHLIDTYHHKGIFIDIENGDIDADEFCRLLCEYAGKKIPCEEIGKAWRSIIDPPQEYKLEYIRELRKTHRVFLLTNNNPIIMDWACAPGFTQSGNALSDYFDKLYISYKMKCTKPDLKIYKMMIEDAGIDPSESLFIDDSEQNIKAGRACGLQVYLAENRTDWREDVSFLIRSRYCP